MVMEFEVTKTTCNRIKEFNNNKRPLVLFKELKFGTVLLYMHGTREGLLGTVDGNAYNPVDVVKGALERSEKLRKSIIDSNRSLGIISCHCGLIEPFDVCGVHVVPICDTKEEIQTYVDATIDDDYILTVYIK